MADIRLTISVDDKGSVVIKRIMSGIAKAQKNIGRAAQKASEKTVKGWRKVINSLKKFKGVTAGLKQSLAGIAKSWAIFSASMLAGWYVISRIAKKAVGVFVNLAKSILLTTEMFRKYNIILEGVIKGHKEVEAIAKWAILYARVAPITYIDIMQTISKIALIPSVKPLLTDTKNLNKNLKELFIIVQGIFLLRPERGVEAATAALRMGLIGMTRRLRMAGVNLDQVAALVGKTSQQITKDSEALLRGLYLYFEKYMGATAFEQLGALLQIQLDNIQDALLMSARDIGDAGFFDVVSDQVMQVVTALTALQETALYRDWMLEIGESFAKIFNSILQTATMVFNTVVDLAGISKTEIIEQVTSAADMLEEEGYKITDSLKETAIGFGVLTAAGSRALDGLRKKLERLPDWWAKNKVEILAFKDSLFEMMKGLKEILPELTKLMKIIKEVTFGFIKFLGEHPKIAKAFIAYKLFLTPLIPLFSGLAAFAGAGLATGGVKAIGLGFLKTAGAVVALKVALIGIAALGIGKIFYEAVPPFKKFVDALGEGVKHSIDFYKEWFKSKKKLGETAAEIEIKIKPLPFEHAVIDPLKIAKSEVRSFVASVGDLTASFSKSVSDYANSIVQDIATASETLRQELEPNIALLEATQRQFEKTVKTLEDYVKDGVVPAKMAQEAITETTKRYNDQIMRVKVVYKIKEITTAMEDTTMTVLETVGAYDKMIAVLATLSDTIDEKVKLTMAIESARAKLIADTAEEYYDKAQMELEHREELYQLLKRQAIIEGKMAEFERGWMEETIDLQVKAIDNLKKYGLTFQESFALGMESAALSMKTNSEIMATEGANFVTTMHSSFATLFEDMSQGTADIKSMWSNFCNSISQSFIKAVSQMMANWIMFGSTMQQPYGGRAKGGKGGGLMGLLGNLAVGWLGGGGLSGGTGKVVAAGGGPGGIDVRQSAVRSYQRGGIIPETGLIYAHKGEEFIPAGEKKEQSITLVNIVDPSFVDASILRRPGVVLNVINEDLINRGHTSKMIRAL